MFKENSETIRLILQDIDKFKQQIGVFDIKKLTDEIQLFDLDNSSKVIGTINKNETETDTQVKFEKNTTYKSIIDNYIGSYEIKYIPLTDYERRKELTYLVEEKKEEKNKKEEYLEISNLFKNDANEANKLKERVVQIALFNSNELLGIRTISDVNSSNDSNGEYVVIKLLRDDNKHDIIKNIVTNENNNNIVAKINGKIKTADHMTYYPIRKSDMNTGGKNSRKAGKRRSVKGKRSKKKSSKKSSKRTRRRRVRK